MHEKLLLECSASLMLRNVSSKDRRPPPPVILGVLVSGGSGVSTDSLDVDPAVDEDMPLDPDGCGDDMYSEVSVHFGAFLGGDKVG